MSLFLRLIEIFSILFPEKNSNSSKIVNNQPTVPEVAEKVSKCYSYAVNSKGKNIFITVNEAANFDFICKSCHSSFLSFPLVKHHLWSGHKVNKFYCTYCDEEVSVEAFVYHMTHSHSGEKRAAFLCKNPEESSAKKPELRAPGIPVETKTVSLPSECCYSFIAYNGFRLILSCDKAAIFNCEVCNKPSPTKFHLQIHMKEVHSITHLKCMTCLKDVKFAVLREHANNHPLSQNCAIFVCIDTRFLTADYQNYSMTFFKKNRLFCPYELFVKFVKKTGESNLFKCLFCRVEFKEVTLFDLHIKESHRCVTFTCQVCTVRVDFTEILNHLNNDHVMKAKAIFKFKATESPIPSSDMCIYSFRLLDSNEGGYIDLKLVNDQPVHFKCYVCQSELDTLKDFDEHIIGEHCAPFRFNCTYCDLRLRVFDLFEHWTTSHKYVSKIQFVETAEMSSEFLKLFYYLLIILYSYDPGRGMNQNLLTTNLNLSPEQLITF